MIKINEWLLPLSWIYGIGAKTRNMLFDIGLLKSTSYKIPVISVGNITVGGTGKTPHVEYLIALLKEKTNIAVLSRGYRRKSKGFQIVTEESSVADAGDEPLQMKHKNPDITVAVCKSRRQGIERLTSGEGGDDIDVILLDDAFQHRYVKPGINILLVDYHRLIIYDRLLPAGRLREPLSGKNRADIVIVTKCPKNLKPMSFRVLTKAINLYPYQHLFFSTYDYSPLQQLFGKDSLPLKEIDKETNILLLTGIASPRQMIFDLESEGFTNICPISFGDHHNFKTKDVELINNTFADLPLPRLIITTEKDAARLIAAEGLSEDVRGHIYALPVNVRFLLDKEEAFNENIIGYVRKNSKNSILAKGKDDHTTHDSHNPGHRTRTISFRNNR